MENVSAVFHQRIVYSPQGKIGAMLTTSGEESKGKYNDITPVATMSSKLNNSDSSSMPPIKFYAAHFARMIEHDMEESVTNEVIILYCVHQF